MTEVDAQLIEEGARAQAALDYLAPIFAALRSAAMERWNGSQLQHVELREKLFMSVRAFNAAESAIRSVVEQAQAAEIMAQHQGLQVAARNALAEQGLTRP